MRSLHLFLTALTFGGLAVILGTSGPANAAPSPVGEPRQGQVVHRDQFPPRIQKLLTRVDVRADTFTVESAASPGTFFRGADGWVLDIPAPDPENLSTQNFEAGACAGRFFAIRRVSNYLEWGASNTCESTSGSFYPHTIEDTLRIGIDPFNIRRMELYRDVGRNDRFARVASVVGSATCIESKKRVYDQVVRVSVRGTQYGPFVDKDSTAPCDLSP